MQRQKAEACYWQIHMLVMRQRCNKWKERRGPLITISMDYSNRLLDVNEDSTITFSRHPTITHLDNTSLATKSDIDVDGFERGKLCSLQELLVARNTGRASWNVRPAPISCRTCSTIALKSWKLDTMVFYLMEALATFMTQMLRRELTLNSIPKSDLNA